MRQQIVDDIRKLAKANDGKPPGVVAFERATGVREAAWRGVYWARWSDALSEAGFKPNEWQGKLDADYVFQKFIEACRYYRHIPTGSELQIFSRGRDGFPAAKSFYKRFGSKDAFLDKCRSWLLGQDSVADVLALFSGNSPIVQTGASREGLVYLIKSGAYYKVGRSDQLERRVKEIRIALPEAAVLVHSIRTDDPSGIEAYWHRRFSEKRANGEWFKLSNADVAAFKRRKFQ
ncbi:hypothetical protein RPB_0922 [Rhodopseudomonas palustris HaA2]|uniref:Bacteriophage T5 Orf172 DNA-binding domain-containing protein n=1 Tax=Rhodopseudomonas palustris (strain HaA2) TaxID=316058 RepID=Q2J1M7_RHOP2|nr:GIY-YIG nuclease family protein [Rhodopseudomonas palustris]ABD05633.1 hypothetical protein RPB_0922 [Rhodopseudomonas palustris HaA2]